LAISDPQYHGLCHYIFRFQTSLFLTYKSEFPFPSKIHAGSRHRLGSSEQRNAAGGNTDGVETGSEIRLVRSADLGVFSVKLMDVFSADGFRPLVGQRLGPSFVQVDAHFADIAGRTNGKSCCCILRSSSICPMPLCWSDQRTRPGGQSWFLHGWPQSPC